MKIHTAAALLATCIVTAASVSACSTDAAGISPEQLAVTYVAASLAGDGKTVCAMEIQPVSNCAGNSPVVPTVAPAAVGTYTSGSATGVFIRYTLSVEQVQAVEVVDGKIRQAAIIGYSAPLTQQTMAGVLKWRQ